MIQPNVASVADSNAGKKKFNVCLVGMGGVGTIAALVLEKSGRAQVTAVLRSSYDAVKESGFGIESIDHGSIKGWRPHRIVPTIPDAANTTITPATKEIYDYVVLATKQLPDKYSCAALIAPLITPSHTTILLLQNGLNIHLPLIQAYPTNPLCSAVSMIGSFTTGPATISHIGHDVLQIGPHYHPGVPDALTLSRTQDFIAMYAAGGAKQCTLAPDMMYARWRKLLWNGSFNTVCALTGLNIGELSRAGGRETLIMPMMREIAAVAARDGHVLSEEVIMEMAMYTSETSAYRPSMLLDRDQGRPMEFEAILGQCVVRAEEVGVPVPKLAMVYEMLKLARWQMESR